MKIIDIAEALKQQVIDYAHNKFPALENLPDEVNYHLSLDFCADDKGHVIFKHVVWIGTMGNN